MITVEVQSKTELSPTTFVCNEYIFENGCVILHSYDEDTGQVVTMIFPLENLTYIKAFYDADEVSYEAFES